ncbi:MAG: efflux RND transporter periplasmic adaptor subunit [Chloroflexi bacterium]|nr:efflux RND transporter periplasmic adaptor subunit [Chloroflexota bacterium]
MRVRRGAWLSLGLVAILSLLIALTGGCQFVGNLTGGASSPAAKPQGFGGGFGGGTVVSAVPVKQGKIASVLTYSGTLQPVAQVTMIPRVTGRVEKVLVDVGAEVKKGAVLVELEKATLQAQVRQAEAGVAVAEIRLASVQAGSREEDISSAEAALASARARLELTRKGPTAADLQAAQSAVTAAEATLQRAESDLAKLKGGPTAEDLRQLELEIERQRTNLWQTQSDRDGTCGNTKNPPYMCQIANAKVAAQEVVVAQAENNLAKLRNGPRAEDLATAERSVTSARAQLESAQVRLSQLRRGSTAEDIQIAEAAVRQAENQLALRRTPYTSRDVESARAGLAQAQAALEVARLQLVEATIVAPFDGVVLQKQAVPGAVITQQSPVLTIGSRDLEILVSIDEARVAQIESGHPATMKVPAYPEASFDAVVDKIFPAGDTKSHNFTVRVTPKRQDDRLRAGMFAEVQIVTRQRDQALLVPKDALVERDGKPSVFVVADGRVALRPVRIGIRAANEVEVAEGVAVGESVVTAGGSGLRDGDTVRVAGGASPAGGAQPGQGGQIPQGGRPGGDAGGAPGKPGSAQTPQPKP